MAMANINKKHFLLAGSCAVVRSVVSRSSLGGRRQGIREVKEIGILRKVLFCASASCVAKARWWQRNCSSGSRSERGERKARNTRRNIAEHRTSIGSNKCICWADAAIEKRRNVLVVDSWLITRSGVSELLFVLCIALTPQSGDSSGAILEVPFKALLHLPHANGVSGLWRFGNLDKKKHKWPYKITRACVCACYLDIPELSSNPIA